MIHLRSAENRATLGYQAASSGSSYNYSLHDNPDGSSSQILRDEKPEIAHRKYWFIHFCSGLTSYAAKL
jgi:hypothetical protein